MKKVAAPQRAVDVQNGKFPYCLVWVPLPIIAWLVPFVGHVGICRQDGVILDFAGVINIDNLAFGSTAKYVSLREEEVLSPNICCQSFVPILNSRASFKPDLFTTQVPPQKIESLLWKLIVGLIVETLL